ncbi:MAG TPA: cation:proton antiporter [Bacteroidales bacterium]|nr:cation:proton antiporter [Bacteroidales bacterium]
MDTYVLLIVSFLLLLSYFFELTSKSTKIPTVLLLIFLGWGLKQLVVFFNIQLPAIENLVQSIGTIGLILIVFEATIDLKFTKNKLPIFFKSILFSLLSILLFSFSFALVLINYFPTTFYAAFLNAIPFSVISSAIAIPSISNYKHLKEFVVYDSTFSDIFGILIFNLVLNLEQGNIVENIGFYFLELLLLLIFSLAAIIVLAIFVRKITHHVKFIPILIFVIFLYQIMKIYHLPGLIFVLIFGLSVANFDYIIRWKEKYLSKFHVVLEEIPLFKSIVSEFTFLVRSVFFLLLGYSIIIENSHLNHLFFIIGTMLLLIYLIRFILLKSIRLPASSYLLLAPRGLITIVLFFSIPASEKISILNNTVAISIILISTILMSISFYFIPNSSVREKNKV